MTKETQTVWHDKSGSELLIKKGANRYYIPASYLTLEQISELAEACADAVKAETKPEAA